MQEAAQLVVDAREGRSEAFLPSKWRLRSWLLWAPVRLLLQVAATLNLVLAVEDGLFQCTPNAAYAQDCVLRDDPVLVKFIEALLLLVLASAWAADASCRASKRDPWVAFVGLSLMLSWMSVTVHLLSGTNSSTEDDNSVQLVDIAWAVRASMRPIPFLHLFPSVRRKYFDLFLLVPQVMGVFCVALMFIAIFALFARILVLDPTVAGNDYRVQGNGFSSIFSSIKTTFWWATGNNGPEPGDQQGSPGFKAGSFWAFFWAFFTSLETFYMLQIVTAVVCDNYSEMISLERARQANCLKEKAQAIFDLLVAQESSPDGDMVPSARIQELGRAARPFFWRDLRLQRAEHDIDSVEAMMSQLMEEDTLPVIKRPRDKPSVLRRILESNRAILFFRVLCLVNLVLILSVAEDHLQSQSTTHVLGHSFANYMSLLIVVLFLADILCALAIGLRAGADILRSPAILRWSLTASVLVLMVALMWGDIHGLSLFYQFHAMLLLQLVDAAQFFSEVRSIYETMAVVAPQIFNLLLACICTMYSWSVFGVVIHKGNFTLANEALAAVPGGVLYTMNFNTVENGIYTLFMSVYGNNIQQFTAAFVVTGGNLGLAHFMLYYIFGMVISGNVVISVLIDTHQQVTKARRARTRLNMGELDKT
ncbi:COMM domain-containing protein 4, partial [Durusdinium trenchii]